MRKIVLTTLLILGTSGAFAANEWGIEHESKARFDAKVVDVLCELTGDCPANCGDGKRQLGLLKDDGKLMLVLKNFEAFTGAVRDLLPFCNQRITADGLMIDNPKMPMMALQFKRPAPDGKWSRANWFGRDWAKVHGGEPGSGRVNNWFRHDPTVKEVIETDGVFGILGLKPEE